MTRNDLQPAGGTPIWPMATTPAGNLALSPQWDQRNGWGLPDLNLASLWRIISEWRWLILASIGVCLAGAIIVSLLTTPIYRASATLEINPPAVEVFQGNKTGQPVVQNDGNFLATQYGLLRSRSLAERVAQQLNLASNPEFLDSEADRATRLKMASGILMANFTIHPAPSSRLVEIRYSSPEPELAARITNSFADSFINTNLERRYEASSYARTFLQNQIRKVKLELERSERQLVAYAQRQGLINTANLEVGRVPGDASSPTGQSLLELNEALARAQTQRISAEHAYRQTLNIRDTAAVEQSTLNLRQNRAQLESEYQEKLSSFKPDYPDMVRLRNRIDSLGKQIAREAGVAAGAQVGTALAAYRSAVGTERQLQARVNQLKQEVLQLRGRSINYNILQREVDTNRSLYDALLQRYKEIGVAGGIGTNQISVVDRAEPPSAPYKPNLPLNLAVGLVIGLVGGLGSALAIEFVNDTIKTPDDVRTKLRLASLGVIPRKQGQQSLAEELKDQTSAVAEAYFSLRTSLQFSTDAGAPKTLLVTSTRAAEGKSSTTLALSQNFARIGSRVLLIDGDLRKPAFTTGAEPNEGLSKLLTNQDPLHAHVLKTQFENLWLVPCGPLPPNPAELLASPRLKALLAEATSHFDMVIVDGPPVMGLADAPLLGAACKGTLLVIESGKTRTHAAMDTVNRLHAAGCHIIGAVLTKYRHRVGGYGYNYEPYRYGGIETNRDREIQLIAHREV